MVAYICNPGTWKTEAERLLWVQGLPKPQSETVRQKIYIYFLFANSYLKNKQTNKKKHCTSWVQWPMPVNPAPERLRKDSKLKFHMSTQQFSEILSQKIEKRAGDVAQGQWRRLNPQYWKKKRWGEWGEHRSRVKCKSLLEAEADKHEARTALHFSLHKNNAVKRERCCLSFAYV